MGKILGILLMIGGVVVGLVVTAVLFVMYNDEQLTAGGAVLGFAIAMIVIVLPQLGIGIYLYWHNSRQAVDDQHAQKQRQLLNMVQTHGQISIADLVIEMGSTREAVQKMLYDLVGMGLFSGYVNWQEGMLYSRQASELRDLNQCANCSGRLELAGHGVISCPYCGTEYFLD